MTQQWTDWGGRVGVMHVMMVTRDRALAELRRLRAELARSTDVLEREGITKYIAELLQWWPVDWPPPE